MASISVGQRFGRLTVVELFKDGPYYKARCHCDCGGEKSPQTAALKSGVTQSCGCLHRERTRAKNTRHGYAPLGPRRSEYNVWRTMIARCHRESAASYERYGARGITVCDRWRFGEGDLSGFQCFIADMGDKPLPKSTIERRDNSKGYSPENCLWDTRTTQARNRSCTVHVHYRGEDHVLAELCEELGVPYRRTYRRIHVDGWDIEDALHRGDASADTRFGGSRCPRGYNL